eukprot:TRINITY_DN3028_c0_g2_i1.p1 TRINITY_DN3028_c0_g2~~TRINITY_DN3028_c0_g2_i1.p1  ORF type:complete len:178 (+),score=46.08 TRINITY_DN3028_c0_g2_i1:459-992(+)
MGGQISVESRKHLGSKFTFFIKCDITDVSPHVTTKNHQAEKKTGASIDGDPRKCRVLVVEDNAVNIRILSNYLMTYGCTFTTASNGREALERYVEDLFDIILMDIEMPIMNGLEASSKIRQHEKANNLKPVPIVGLSGNARGVQIAAAKAHGMSDYLSKPYHREELYKVIKENVKKL